ncbi:GAF domain-containing protein [Pontibacter beigongshangensis]|uniref:GAF domain-containing protein n=1 Tax=Pontibacter beigongshangensis TaxID=2574733 RepID=UPI0016500788|nr:GAF domain-containing protein [Pontibacter beigongshangensis]
MISLNPSIPSSSSLIEVYEEHRLQALHTYDKYYTAAEQEFNILVALASTICETPISLISLLTTDRQWFKAGIGLDVKETPQSVSFCQYAIEQDDVLEVPDALSDIRFFQNPYVVGEPKIRFYAGSPLVNKDGHKLGTLCVIDTQPRELSEKQRFALASLSEQVTAHLELRLRKDQLEQEKSALQKAICALSHLRPFDLASDLKTSVSGVKSMTDQIEKAILSKDISTISDSIHLLKTHLQELEAGLQPFMLTKTPSQE